MFIENHSNSEILKFNWESFDRFPHCKVKLQKIIINLAEK